MLLLRALLVSIGLMFSAATLASAPPKEEASTRSFAYVSMEPAFVVNVGEKGPVGYLRADISLRVENAALEAVKHHMPVLRHELIILLSRQAQERLEAMPTREEVRLEALEVVRRILKEADGIEEGVTDLMFTSFLIQR
jgi:flagellar FliL protein